MQIIGLIAFDSPLGKDRHFSRPRQKNAPVDRVDKEAAGRDFATGRRMVKDKGAHEGQAGWVVDKPRRPNDEIGGAGVGIGLIQMNIGGRRNTFVEYRAVKNTAGCVNLDHGRLALRPNPDIAAQAETATANRRVDFVKLIATDGNVADIATGLALRVDGHHRAHAQ